MLLSHESSYRMTPLESNKVTNKNLPINHIPAAGMKTDVRIRAVTLQLLMQSYTIRSPKQKQKKSKHTQLYSQTQGKD